MINNYVVIDHFLRACLPRRSKYIEILSVSCNFSAPRFNPADLFLSKFRPEFSIDSISDIRIPRDRYGTRRGINLDGLKANI